MLPTRSVPPARPRRPPVCAPTRYHARHSRSAFLTDAVLRYLSVRRAQSWFAHVCYIAPHPPFVASAPFHAMYRPADMPPCRAAQDAAAEARQHQLLAHYLRRQQRRSFFAGTSEPVSTLSAADFAQLRATYCGMVSEVDVQLGRLLGQLDEWGLADETLIVVTGDHGEMLGDHWMLGKEGYFAEAYHVPLVIRAPGAAPGQEIAAFTEAVDVMPTILEWIGVPPPPRHDGRSLLAVLPPPGAGGGLARSGTLGVRFQRLGAPARTGAGRVRARGAARHPLPLRPFRRPAAAAVRSRARPRLPRQRGRGAALRGSRAGLRAGAAVVAYGEQFRRAQPPAGHAAGAARPHCAAVKHATWNLVAPAGYSMQCRRVVGIPIRRKRPCLLLPAAPRKHPMRFRTLLATVAGVLPVSLVLIVLFIGIYAWPAIHFNGPGFVVRDFWSLGNLYADPVTVAGVSVQPGAQYGILFLIVGTLLTTLIAMLIALPIGVGAAVFLAEAVPGRLRLWLSVLVELLAAIPSVVYGLWGYVVLIPFLGHHLYPFLARTLSFLPIFGGPPGSGYGLLTAGLVLSLMIVPLITATLARRAGGAAGLGAGSGAGARRHAVRDGVEGDAARHAAGADRGRDPRDGARAGRDDGGADGQRQRAELPPAQHLFADRDDGLVHRLPARQRAAGPVRDGGALARRDRADPGADRGRGERGGAAAALCRRASRPRAGAF